MGALLLAGGREACAQERDPAAAQALFDEARRLVQRGKFNEACPKFVESNRLDAGIGTQFHLADCYERAGRTASAWATFLEVASQARLGGQLDREKVAQKRADKLEPLLPRLQLNVPEASRVPGLEIRRNGVLVGSAQWGTPVPIDPGEIEIVASAPGKRSLQQTLRVQEGKTVSFDLPALAAAGAVPATAEEAEPDGGEGVEKDSVEPGEDAAAERKKPGPLFYMLAAGGALGLGIGAGFALMARSTYEDSKAHCDPANPNSCDAKGVSLRNDARSKGDIATVGVVAGGAALAGAVLVLVLDGGSSDKPQHKQGQLRTSAALGPRQGAVYLQGSF